VHNTGTGMIKYNAILICSVLFTNDVVIRCHFNGIQCTFDYHVQCGICKHELIVFFNSNDKYSIKLILAFIVLYLFAY
jgi:hypothetical protein